MTTTKNSIGQRPYYLVFGCEAVIPQKFMILIPETRFSTNEENDKMLAENIHIVEKLRDLFNIRITTYYQRISKSYDKKIRKEDSR